VHRSDRSDELSVEPSEFGDPNEYGQHGEPCRWRLVFNIIPVGGVLSPNPMSNTLFNTSYTFLGTLAHLQLPRASK